jgi:hypothetical protein
MITNFVLRIVKLLIYFTRKRYALIIIDRRMPPYEGDSIQVGGLTAIFKKDETNPSTTE